MTTNTTHLLPPHRFHSTRRLSQGSALSFLSAYLVAASVDPCLQPNAVLTESGPRSVTQGTTTGLVLHNLKRVEAGLKGEHLGSDLTFERYGGEGLPGLHVEENGGTVNGKAKRKGGKGEERQGERIPENQTDDIPEGEWMDKEAFEREQDEEVGDVGNRGNEAVAEGMVEEGLGKMKVTETAPKRSKAEREARKKDKKERRKDRIREKEKEKAKRKES